MTHSSSTVDDLIELIRVTARLDDPIDSQTPVISSGLIDSFDVVTLLAAIDRHFGVSIAPEEIEVERFDTPQQMLSQIDGTRG